MFPLAYILMEKKSEAAYIKLFEELKKFVLGEVINVMTDYETALRNSIRKIYPGTSIHGCFFHFGQAVYRKGRALQLPLYSLGNMALRMAMALPLLPVNDIDKGIDLICNLLKHDEFSTYLQKWKRLFVSVYGLQHRTNNSVESFHHSLYSMVGRPHPNVWVFVNMLKRMEHVKSCDLKRFENGVALPTLPRAKYRKITKKIEAAQKSFLEDNISITQFLRYCGNVAVPQQFKVYQGKFSLLKIITINTLFYFYFQISI